jgi:hypothetical protein
MPDDNPMKCHALWHILSGSMGSIHQLPTSARVHARLLQQLVKDTIANHPDKRVAKAWADMAEQSLARYPGPPSPSHPVLDLDAVDELTSVQKQQVEELTKNWLEHYLADVRDQLMCVHRDLLVLQRRVAELENG